ncbi:hypothetical protein [Rhodococcus sp. SJ-3]|uniref:hypothetical protein n=1 Tax=Rhodococcus sp. SJ-3 TaxID=3454628 RepID=UPI003F78C7F1
MSLIDADKRRSDPADFAAQCTDADAQPPLPPQVRRQRLPVAILCVALVVAVALYLAGLRNIDLQAMTGLGLISVLTISTMLGPGLIVLGFIGTLSLSRRRTWLLGIHLVLLVLMLHGITLLLESEPRFPISWVHIGFVEFIARTGTTAPDLDARWSWPGFFALAAFWGGSGDLSALHTAVSVASVGTNLLYLVALGLLMSPLRMSWQAKWLAAMFFCLLNWIGQDYFSPQGFALVLYLLFVGFLVVWFRTPHSPSGDAPWPLRPGNRLWRWVWGEASRGELPQRKADPSERVVILAVVVGLFAAATVCHQLTPFAMILSAAGLVVARRCVLRGLPVLLVVIVVAWVSYMTQAYWGGHFGEVMSGVGNVGSTVSANISDRAELGNPEHQWVVRARMLTTVLVFVIAGVGLLRRRRRGIEDRVLLVLITAPIGLAFMQSYGGEMALRVYLFALAPASVLVALALFPRPVSRPSLLARCAACVLGLVMLLSFFVTRYGNEPFERIDSGAVSAVGSVYDQTTDDVRFLYVTAVPELNSTPFMPLGYRDVERVHWSNTMAPLDPSDVTGVLQALREKGPDTYLITTRSQEAFVELGQGYPLGWGDEFRASLADAPGLRTVVENQDATVYSLDWPPDAEAEHKALMSTGVQVWLTPWTGVGVAFLILLVGTLGVREAWRLRLTPDRYTRLRPLTFAAIPLLIGFVLVVLERFAMLTS